MSLMGVTIHYQGRLSDPKQLPKYITAIQHIFLALDRLYIDMNERPLPDWQRNRGISGGEN